jgi:hypothetical protein
MRVLLDNATLTELDHESSFARSLGRALAEAGIELVDPGVEYDVALCFGDCSSNVDLKRPYVLRLSSLDHSSIHYGHASHVVFNSVRVAQGTALRMGLDTPFDVIRDGIEMERIGHVNDALLNLRRGHEWMFVCSRPDWRDVSMGRRNMEIYRMLRRRHPNSCLIVVGKEFNSIPKNCVQDEIFFTGELDFDGRLQVFASADWTLDVVPGDTCPRTILESLSQETPVIVHSDGIGPEYLEGFDRLGSNGLVFDEGMCLANLNPPKKIRLDRDHLTIGECVKGYLEVLERSLVSTNALGG